MLVLLLLGLIASSCGDCDSTTTRIEPHWLRVFEGFDFSASTTFRRGPNEESEIATKVEYGAGYFDDDVIAGNVSPQHYGFWLDIVNRTPREIRLVWADARYIDEEGVAHTVYAQPRGVLPDNVNELRSPDVEIVRSRQNVRPTVVPIYKQYMVASGCRDLLPYSEPLIPTNLKDKDEAQTKVYLKNLADRQAPVKLRLPIEIGGSRYDYEFSFVLRDDAATNDK